MLVTLGMCADVYWVSCVSGPAAVVHHWLCPTTLPSWRYLMAALVFHPVASRVYEEDQVQLTETIHICSKGKGIFVSVPPGGL